MGVPAGAASVARAAVQLALSQAVVKHAAALWKVMRRGAVQRLCRTCHEGGIPNCQVFDEVVAAAREAADGEPALAEMMWRSVLKHSTFEESLAFILSQKLVGAACQCERSWRKVFMNLYMSPPALPGNTERVQRKSLTHLARFDLCAVRERDPACQHLSHVLLNFKGYQALQCHRAAHVLWHAGRKEPALAIQSKCSEVFGVDIHPAACVGEGLLIDHATGVVIGETAAIGRNCTILHGVTLGSSGKVEGDRHPKLGDDVFVGALTTILGNIEIGDGAKIGASSVVLKAIPPLGTAVGVPAKLVGRSTDDSAGKKVDHALHHVQSFLYPNGVAIARPGSSRRHWNDIYPEVDRTERQEGYITRDQLSTILQKLGASEAQADAVFFALDRNLDNRVSESEFDQFWPDVVAKVCPMILAQCQEQLNAALKKSALPPAPMSDSHSQPSRSPPNALASPLRPDQRSHRSASVSNPLVTSPRSAPPNFPRDAWSPPRPPSSLAPRSPTKEWSKFFYTGPNIPQP